MKITDSFPITGQSDVKQDYIHLDIVVAKAETVKENSTKCGSRVPIRFGFDACTAYTSFPLRLSWGWDWECQRHLVQPGEAKFQLLASNCLLSWQLNEIKFVPLTCLLVAVINCGSGELNNPLFSHTPLVQAAGENYKINF